MPSPHIVPVDPIRQVDIVAAELSPRPAPIAAPRRQAPVNRTPTVIEPSLLPEESGFHSTPNATILDSPEDGAAPFNCRPQSPVTVVRNVGQPVSTMTMSKDSSHMKTKGLASRTLSALKKVRYLILIISSRFSALNEQSAAERERRRGSPTTRTIVVGSS